MTRVEEGMRNRGSYDLGGSAKTLAKNEDRHFTQHATEAIQRSIKAFALAKVPLVLAAGSLLGWYRECGIIPHTGDVDFYVIADHIMSMEHFDLLVVR
jgi:hypothetical protein